MNATRPTVRLILDLRQDENSNNNLHATRDPTDNDDDPLSGEEGEPGRKHRRGGQDPRQDVGRDRPLRQGQV